MIQDPYKVLGVSPSDSDEDIQKAYRKLVKKYHPDVNPGNTEAEQKMREINAAYDQIRNIREGKTSYNQSTGQTYTNQSYGNGPYGSFSWEDIFGSGFGNYQQQQEATTELTAARNYIRSGHYKEALNVLNSVEFSKRNARWYYFHAQANYGMGNSIEAMNSAEEAVKLEPNNMEYQQLLNRMKNPGTTYHQYGGGSPIVCGTSNLCFNLCLANILCGLCGSSFPCFYFPLC